MSSKLLNGVPITDSDLEEQMKEAQNLLNSVSWSVKPGFDQGDTSAYSKSLQMQEMQVSIFNLIKAITPEDNLLSDIQLHVLRAIRKGFQVARHIAEDYAVRAGIPSQSSSTGLTNIQITEINEKKQTSAIISLFVWARYIIWDMQALSKDNAYIDGVNVQVGEVEISRLVPALRCSTFYLGKSIEKETHGDDSRLVAVVCRFSELLQQEIINRINSLKHQDYFISVNYQLEETKFVVSGFELMALSYESVEIKEVYPGGVIGNQVAVMGLEQAIRKLFLYDPKTQLNPISNYGGFESVQLLSGDPGNGKTLLLAMARTLGRDYSEASGLPYRDLVVPNMVSKMQGESTDLALDYLRMLFDSNTINLGIGDEFEVVIPDHGGEDVSEGDKKVAVEFLKALSGVSSVDRLNFLFLAATNYPEKLDKAFMSRVKSRHYVTGAETIDDYVRFLILNLRKLNKQHSGLVNLKNVDWERDIREKRISNDSLLKIDPTMNVTDIHEVVSRHYDLHDIRFFATFFYLMRQRQSTFSLRDCTNIVDGTKVHVSGFEIPLEWISESRHYIDLEFDDKSSLIANLAIQHVQASGIDFVEMLNKQTLYYAEESLRMAETRRQREVNDYAEKSVIRHLGDKKFKEVMDVRN